MSYKITRRAFAKGLLASIALVATGLNAIPEAPPDAKEVSVKDLTSCAPNRWEEFEEAFLNKIYEAYVQEQRNLMEKIVEKQYALLSA